MSLIKVGNFGIFIGSTNTAHDDKLLRKNGITGILDIGGNNTVFYKGIRYSQFKINGINFAQFIPAGIDFIDLIRSETGNVLVICETGISLSSTVVVAWLMGHFNISLNIAMTLMRQFHPLAMPDSGFIKTIQKK